MIKAGVAQPRSFRRVAIDFIQITEHGFDRGVQAVKIHSVESHRRSFRIEVLVEASQPIDEFQHDFVAPHPRWEPTKTRKRLVRIGIGADATHVKDERELSPANLPRSQLSRTLSLR
jgi:hypothetical protein